MKYIKLLIVSCIIVNTLNAKTIDANLLGKSIPEQLFQSKIPGIASKKSKTKVLDAVRILAINNSLKTEKNKNKVNKKDIKSKDYFVVANVGDDIITNIDILNAIKFICFASNKPYDKNCAKLILSSVLNILVNDSIRQQFAKLHGIPIDETLVDKKIEEIAKNNNKNVEELGKAFEAAGIDMKIFRRNLRSKLVLNIFYQIMENDMKQQNADDIKQYKSQYSSNIRKTRYKFHEIFLRIDDVRNKDKVEKQANSIIELLESGFSFSIIAENLSNNDNISLDEMKWKNEDTLPNQIKNKLKNMKVGTYSDIIKMKNGYKILYLIDKAEPNKAGQSATTYNVVTGEIPINVQSREEFIKLQEKLQSISASESIDDFNQRCEIYKVKTQKQTITNPDMIQKELIARNKSTNRTGMLRVDETSPIKILFIESEIVPKAEIPSDETINTIISHEKLLQKFNKNMEKIKTQIYVRIKEDNLSKVLENDNDVKSINERT